MGDLTRDGRTAAHPPEFTIHAAAEVPPEIRNRLLSDPAFPLADPHTEIIKEGDTTLVVKTEWTLNGRSRPIAYKCVRRLTWLKQFTQAVGVNRTWRTYRVGLRLIELGIPTARPLLILLPHRRHWHTPTWIANEWLEETSHLGEFVRNHGRTADEGGLDELARLLGTILGRLHRAGGTHRDLKPENIMVRPATNDRPPSIWLIDLDGLRFRRWIGARRRWRDLSRLTVGIEEAGGVRLSLQLRFLLAYLRALGANGDWKPHWQVSRRASQHRHAQRARKSARHVA